MLRIWGRRSSVNVQKVMWTLGELGLEYERVDAGLAFGKNREPWFLELNPNGLIPTLEQEDFVLWESNSIVRYLAATHDPGGLWPEDARTRALAERWMDWQLSSLAPAMKDMYIQLVRTADTDRDDDLVLKGAAECARLFGVVERSLGHAFVAGERLSVGDIPLGAMTHRWYALPIEHPPYPKLRGWYERLRERAAFQQHVMLPLA